MNRPKCPFPNNYVNYGLTHRIWHWWPGSMPYDFSAYDLQSGYIAAKANTFKEILEILNTLTHDNSRED
jgi:hypothetical protein